MLKRSLWIWLAAFALTGNGANSQQLNLTVKPTRDSIDIYQSSLKSYASIIDGSNSFFTIIEQFDNAENAMVFLRKLREKSPAGHYAVYPHVPHTGRAWSVVSAAYASEREAADKLAIAKELKFGSDPLVVRLLPDRWSREIKPVEVYAPSVALPSYPNFIRDPRVGDKGRKWYVYLYAGSNEEGAISEARDIRQKYSGINLAILPPRAIRVRTGPSSQSGPANLFYDDSTWRVAIAAGATEDDANRAIKLSARLGIPTVGGPVSYPYSEVVFENITGADVTHYAWTVADRDLLNREKAIRSRLDECVRNLAFRGKKDQPDPNQNVPFTLGDIRDCAKVIVSPRQLWNCLGTDADYAERSTVDAVRSAYESCQWYEDGLAGLEELKKAGFDLASKVAIEKGKLTRLVPKLEEITECRQSAGNREEAFLACVTSRMMSDEQKVLVECLTRQNDEKATAKCLLAKAKELPLEADTRAKLTCLVDNMSDPAKSADCLVPADLKQKAADLQGCVRRAGADPKAVALCISPNLSSDPNLNRLACLQASAGDKLAAARCLVDGDEARNLMGAASCISNMNASKGDMLGCVAAVGGPDAQKAAECLKAINGDNPLKCLAQFADPKLKQAQEAYNCISNAVDAASAIEACGGAIGDPKTRQAVSCLVRANGDSSAIGQCAAQALLPGEAGRLAGCLASSQGAYVAAALCAYGPQMNEEMRIAVECVVTNGGNPIGSAACTGGRLTVRELTKCLSGKIGQDCFGPNNTLVKFHSQMIEDVKKLLNFQIDKDGELAKALISLSEGLKDLGSLIEQAGKRLIDDWSRNDLNPDRIYDNWRRSDLNPGNWSLPKW
ncbi:hypothetical protein ACWIGM_05060 [Bosea sp. NPDC055332]